MLMKRLYERTLLRVFMNNYLFLVLFLHLIQIHMYYYVLKVMNTGQFRHPVKKEEEEIKQSLSASAAL